MIVTVTFRLAAMGKEMHLVNASIANRKVDGDIEILQVVLDGWTAPFGKLAPSVETKSAA